MGHGKGYYDRLLISSNAITIGLAFEKQIVKKIATEKHDISVDIILTEERIVNCLNSQITS